jgi:hypothetical protein
MNNEALKPIINRIDDRENRIDTTEDQNRKEDRGFMDKVYKIGSIAGLLASLATVIFGGIALWDKHTVKPNTEPKLCDTLHLFWGQDRQLVFKCRLGLHNTGEASDSVRRARAYITSDILSDLGPFKLGPVNVSENGINKEFPLGVKADDLREVDIQTGLKLTEDQLRSFLKERRHRLIFEFDLKEPQQKTVEYCFSIGQETAENLVKDEHLETHEDPVCDLAP